MYTLFPLPVMNVLSLQDFKGRVTYPGKAFLTTSLLMTFFFTQAPSLVLPIVALITPNDTHLGPCLPQPLGCVLLGSKDLSLRIPSL